MPPRAGLGRQCRLICRGMCCDARFSVFHARFWRSNVNSSTTNVMSTNATSSSITLSVSTCRTPVEEETSDTHTSKTSASYIDGMQRRSCCTCIFNCWSRHSLCHRLYELVNTYASSVRCVQVRASHFAITRRIADSCATCRTPCGY